MTRHATIEARAWGIGAVAVSLIVAVPVAVIVTVSASDPGRAWDHVVETRLSAYATNTALLTVLAASLAVPLGVLPAWLLTAYRFPMCKALEWALLLPLAVPPYISAYAYTDVLQFSGPLQSWVRGVFGVDSVPWFPEPRSIVGASLVLACALFPYVFVAARQSFAAHATYTTRVARTLGCGPTRAFASVALPMTLPAILGGVALVVMETIADFGVAEYCAVDTFATGVYRSWLGLDAPGAAARLSLILLTIVTALLGLIHLVRSRLRSEHNAGTPHEVTPLRGLRSVLAIAVCATPITLGFMIPVATLIGIAWGNDSNDPTRDLVTHAANTATLATIAALCAVGLAVVSVYGRRVRPTRTVRLGARVAWLGYAIPGTVVAVGLLIPLTHADRVLAQLATVMRTDDTRAGLLLSGSVFAIVLGCQTRFLAVAISSVEAAFGRVGRSLDDAARTLGRGPTESLLRLHVPACRAGLVVAALLVFADVSKELPMTLLLRPFNFDTLAVRAHQFAAEERLAEASVPALGLVALGLIPVGILATTVTPRGRTAHDA
ncbi:MAG: iron ABC transporter permease [Planctomycetota bacterium]